MSWSINVVGKVSAVRAKAQDDLKQINCMEPEESIKNAVGDIIDTSLCAYPHSVAVKIIANGSQYKPFADKEGIINSVNLTIEPLYWFVE